jgi:chitodextrinase
MPAGKSRWVAIQSRAGGKKVVTRVRRQSSAGHAGQRRDKKAPTTPADFVAGTSTATSIETTWAPATDKVGVTGYRVYRDGAKLTEVPETSYTFSGLACSTGYRLEVAAVDGAGNVSAPAVLDASTSACPDTIAPSMPTQFVVTRATEISLDTSWAAATDNVGVAAYRVYRDGVELPKTTATSYSFSGLMCGTPYRLEVVAVDDAGNASPPATIDASTSACVGPPHSLAAVGDFCSPGCFQGAITAANIRALAPDRVLGLGDYQYEDAGLDGVTFQAGFQPAWGDLAAITIPTFGATHDTCDGVGSWECYPVSFFNANGAPEVVGRLFDNQWGYSFDIGTWHVVVFNYKVSDTSSVAADLDAHPSSCLLAVTHAPLYGSPSTEHPTNEAAPYASVLAAHGVDLILNGHQHFYERNVVDGVTAITNGEGGIGHYTRTSVAPSAVAYDDSSFGVVSLELDDNGWKTSFVPDTGATPFEDLASGGCGA